jgi:membrane protein DedA with SNARE-associated domain
MRGVDPEGEHEVAEEELATEEVAAESRRRPPRRAVAVVGVLIGILVVANNLGSLFTTTLAEDRPALLLALNSSNRSLALTTNQLDAWSYYLLGSLRLLVADPLFFLLGMWYGDAAIRWVERKWASQGEILRLFETWFQKAAYVVVFLAPNNPVCLLAGASGMPLAGFIAANLAGTFARLFVIRWAGDVFSDAIDAVLGFFSDYRLPLFIVSAVLVVGSFLLDRRKGAELDVVNELDSELREASGPERESDG